MGSKNGISGREVSFNAEISRRVEELRESRCVLHIDLARAAGVSPQMLRAYQAGITRWPVFRLQLIAKYFVVDVDSLLPEPKTYVNETRTQGNFFVG